MPTQRPPLLLQVPPERNHRNGFSLIELVTAISVIAILTAIALSALSGVRTMTHRTECLSNLRAIGTGLLTYAADNRGQLPPGLVWDRKIASEYLSGSADNSSPISILHCPADERDLLDDWPRSYVANRTSKNRPDYGVFNTSTTELSAKLHTIEYPGRTVMITELFTGGWAGNRQFSTSYGVIDGWLRPRSSSGYVHGGGQNYLFCDGHVECLDDEELIYTPYQKSRWARNF